MTAEQAMSHAIRVINNGNLPAGVTQRMIDGRPPVPDDGSGEVHFDDLDEKGIDRLVDRFISSADLDTHARLQRKIALDRQRVHLSAKSIAGAVDLAHEDADDYEYTNTAGQL